MATVTFTVPDAFVPRIVSAFKATYPNITANLPDGQAVKAVIVQLTAGIVASYEAGNAAAPLAVQMGSAYDNQHRQSISDIEGNMT